MKNHIIKSA